MPGPCRVQRLVRTGCGLSFAFGDLQRSPEAYHLPVAGAQRRKAKALLDQLEDRSGVVVRVVDAGVAEFLRDQQRRHAGARAPLVGGSPALAAPVIVIIAAPMIVVIATPMIVVVVTALRAGEGRRGHVVPLAAELV